MREAVNRALHFPPVCGIVPRRVDERSGRLESIRRALAAVLLVCLFLQALGHARSASLTFDEGPHLAIGYATLRTGDLRLQPVHIHPPLANVLAALPLLGLPDLPDPRAIPGWEIASLSAITDGVVWQYPHPARLALVGRLPIILMTLLLGALVYRWASDLFGGWAGLLALALTAFDPNIIAHGSLATTDMAVTLWGTASLFLAARALRHRRSALWIGAAVALGLALVSKVSALLLVPVMSLLWLLGPPGSSWRRRLLTTAGGLGLAALVVWAAYGFEVRTIPGFPLPLPAATHVEIYRALQEHYRLGHPAFLWGRNSDHGWWTYFPVAFVLKTPLPTLLLLVVSSWFQVSGFRFRMAAGNLQPVTCNLRPSIRTWTPLLLFPLLYALSALFSSVDIGYRHLLPLLPFVFILASRMTYGVWRVSSYPRTTHHVSRFTFHVSRLGLSALLVWLVVGTVGVAPHYLAFFNELAGGAAGGYRYLVDSNLDWGQNLWQLRDWMRDHGVTQIFYAHFSPARPAVYGIQADLLPPSPDAAPFAPLNPAPGLYALGATVLQGVYTPDVNTYAAFRSREPLARLGYALFLYRVSPRPPVGWAAVCASPLPVLAPEAVRAGFGRTDLRVAQFDCGQSLLYPAGLGAILLPPDTEAPPGATADLQACRADGQPLYTLYRAEGGPPVPQHPLEATLDGPLTFLGYQVTPETARAGQEVTLWTFWRVDEAPVRPLSLMAHLVGDDGAPLAVGDGLGVPIEQWQPGDVILQRHRLVIPEGTPAGRYALHVGAYWLDTMARWSARLPDGTLADHLSLAEVTIFDR